MRLPESVAIKLSAYTLFCRQLLEHLPSLHDATRTDPRLTCDECCRRFSEELRRFLHEADVPDLQRAVETLGEAVISRAGYFQDQNPQAAAVLHNVVGTARAAVPDWHYQADLEELHEQGRHLARWFYSDSPWNRTRGRLAREARLAFLYEGQEARQVEVLGHRPAPLTFRERYQDEETEEWFGCVIVLRFTFSHDFGLYLAYPFLFMHEYVSHIFACDYGNERFNDGWLLYAADKFLFQRGWDQYLQPALAREQINAFGDQMHHRLNPIPRKACSFARSFDGWLKDKSRFQQITWELAAYEPDERGPFWPDQFINRLEQEFDTDRPRLQQKIEAAPDVRTLFETLPPV